MTTPRSSYLLTDISPELRQALSASAAEQDASLQDIVLRALYDHYALEFPKLRGRRYTSWMDKGSSRLVIRATPELFEEVKYESAHSSRTMRQTIIDILSDHYLVGLGS